MELGCYFSVNAAMLKHGRGRKLVDSLPADRLLMETDGPFTDGIDGPAGSADVAAVLDNLASMRRLERDAMSELIAANLRALLS
jgi:TatD DNase family protein